MSDFFKKEFLAAIDGPADDLNALLEDHLTVVQTRMKAVVQEILAAGGEDINETTAAYAMLFNEVSGLVVRFDSMMALFENNAAGGDKAPPEVKKASSLFQKLRHRKRARAK